MKTVNFEPVHEKLEVQTGTNLLDTLLAKKFNVLMACGGKGLCATCHVQVRQGMDKLSNRTEREKMTLSFISGTNDCSRLACQARVLGEGVVLELPQGMYIERAEDLLSLLGTRAPTDILHPLQGTVLIAKGKIITRSQIQALKHLNAEMERVKAGGAPAAPPPMPRNPPAVNRPNAPSRPPAPAPAPAPAAKHPSQRFAIGATLGKCLLMEKIGQGATGTVYRALHTTLNIPVAIKALHFEDAGDDRRNVQKFADEARLLAQLNHPNIVRVWDFEADPYAPYLVLEHVEGLSLEELIRQSGRLCLDRAVPVVRQTAEALAAAWKLGVVHRDVKPANILVARDGAAKLADLGLAVAVGGKDKAAADGLAGTVAYMAPEQAGGAAAVDCRSDMYALGATFYHAVTGQLPFSGKTRVEVLFKHASMDAPPPHLLVPEVDPAASAVIARMMAKKREDRYADYRELIAALAGLEAASRRAESAPAVGHSTDSPSATLSPSAADRPAASRRTFLSILGWRKAETKSEE